MTNGEETETQQRTKYDMCCVLFLFLFSFFRNNFETFYNNNKRTGMANRNLTCKLHLKSVFFTKTKEYSLIPVQ